MNARSETSRTDYRRVIAAGIVLGIGLGGFIDGIALHQLLQTHNMLSATYPTRGVDLETTVVNLEINMFWDGLFHLFTWLMTVLGVALLWHALRRAEVLPPTRVLIGSFALGWGLFNLVEGIIDHHVLHIHHVVEGPNHLPWDLAFLISGVVLIIVGWAMIQHRAGEGVAQSATAPAHQA